MEYEGWCSKQAEFELEMRYPGTALKIKMDETAGLARKSDRRFAAIPGANQPKSHAKSS